MPAEGWPIFAEWEARKAEEAARKLLPYYGGNNIPDSYLNKFNAETDAWLRRIGARTGEPEVYSDTIPKELDKFVRLL